jgi:hypothetical protein
MKNVPLLVEHSYGVMELDIRGLQSVPIFSKLNPNSFIATSFLKTAQRVNYMKVKVKLSLCFTKHHARKTYWGSGSIAPCIF